MVRIIKFSLLGLLLFLSSCLREQTYREHIQSVDSFSPAFPLLMSCSSKTFITFDVDDTLITARDVIARDFRSPLIFKFLTLLKYPELLKKDRFEWAASIVFAQAERYVFDPQVVKIIRHLQQQECNVLGLTSIETGSFGTIPNMSAWRAHKLKALGIDFQRKFADATLTSLPSHRGNYPQLYQGILCTNQQPKGKVLGAFLDYYHLNPEKIISFDDNQKDLVSIARECAQRNIRFIGFHYKGAEKIVGVWLDQWNTKRALKQVDVLMQEGHWMSDKDYARMLENMGTIH